MIPATPGDQPLCHWQHEKKKKNPGGDVEKPAAAWRWPTTPPASCNSLPGWGQGWEGSSTREGKLGWTWITIRNPSQACGCCSLFGYQWYVCVPGEGWAVSGCSEGEGLPHGAASSCLILSPHSWVGGTQFQHMILLKITRAIIPATELGACAGGDLERNRTSGEQVRVQVCAPKRTPSDGGPASLLSQGPEPLSAFISLDWLCLKQMERSPKLG